jgi:DNA adenine methylase
VTVDEAITAGVEIAPDGGSCASLIDPSVAPPRRRKRQRQLRIVEDRAQPIVKWPGGKGRMLTQIQALAPSSFGTYFEPFAGGAALFFRLAPERAVLSDANGDLIELYAEVARDPVGLHRAVSALIESHISSVDPSALYYGRREAWNMRRTDGLPQHRAAMLVYLNRAGFNGLFRLNRDGMLNVPLGKPSKSAIPAAWPACPSLARFIAASQALSRAVVRCASYADVLALVESGDFVYLDPPYPGTFSAYTSGGFSSLDHDLLGRRACELVDRGVQVMVSSSDLPGARDRYPGFVVHETSSPHRSISAGAVGRKSVPELILTGGYVAGSYVPGRDS